MSEAQMFSVPFNNLTVLTGLAVLKESALVSTAEISYHKLFMSRGFWFVFLFNIKALEIPGQSIFNMRSSSRTANMS
jgi:hypothetical protein